jgi:hypothetical protein
VGKPSPTLSVRTDRYTLTDNGGAVNLIVQYMGPAVDGYRGVVNFHGIPVGLEHVAGNTHPVSGRVVNVNYGEIPGTTGVDGDPVDVFLGDDWGSETAYILQDSHGTDADTMDAPPQYGEDKVCLGFSSEAQARAAHAAYYRGDATRKIVGVIATDVDSLRERLQCPEFVSLPYFKSDIIKSDNSRPPAGFSPIPHGRKGGFRKKDTHGAGWTYWYPEQHHHRQHDEWEDDAGKGTGIPDDAKPGQFFRVQGRLGTYVWTPDAVEKPPSGMVVMTKYDPAEGAARGEPEFFNPRSVVSQRGKAARIERPTKVGKPPQVERPRRAATDKPPQPPVIEDRPRKLTEGEDARERTRVYEDSTARPGSFLHRLENGHYPVIKISSGDGDRVHKGTDVPPSDHAQMMSEFGKPLRSAARSIASAYRIPVIDGTGARSPDYEEVESGAMLGFVMALRAYSGGRPFVPMMQDYVKTYASRAAQQTLVGGSATVPRRMMTLAHSLIAARARARTKGEENPSPEKVAKHWRVLKGDVFRQGRSLGSYAAEGPDGKMEIRSQDNEELPMEDWRVVGPDGREHGAPQPGKLSMIARLNGIVSGEKVSADDILASQESGLLPRGVDSGLTVGSAHHARSEVESILAEMKPRSAQALSLIFGLGESGGGDRGELTDTQLADQLGLGGKDASDRTKRREGAKAREAAVAEFKALAGRDSLVRQFADHWTRPAPQAPDLSAFGPSHSDLLGRFGSDERVRLYQLGLRTGDSERVGKILDREVAGKATDDERHELRAAYYAQRADDRLQAFREHAKMRIVDPSLVKEPMTGSSPYADHLYTEELLTNALQAVASGHGGSGRDMRTSTRTPGQSKVMSDERFRTFMGRRDETEAASGG